MPITACLGSRYVKEPVFIDFECNGTSDCSGRKQEPIIVRNVSEDLNIHKDFLESYHPPDFTSDILRLL